MSEPTDDNESEQPEGQARRPALSFGDDNTSQLPHWSEPATGEVPVFGTSDGEEEDDSPAAGRSRLFPQLPDDPNLVDSSSPTDVFRPVDEADDPGGASSDEPGDQPGEDSAWAAPTWAGEDEVPPDEPDRTVAAASAAGAAGSGSSAGDETRPMPVIADAGPTAQPGDEMEPHDDEAASRDQETELRDHEHDEAATGASSGPGQQDTGENESGEVAGAAVAGAALTGGAAVAGAAAGSDPGAGTEGPGAGAPPVAGPPDDLEDDATRRAGAAMAPTRTASSEPSSAVPTVAAAAAAGSTTPPDGPSAGGAPSWQDEVIWPAESLSPTNPESERLIFGEDMDEPVPVGRGRWSAGAARDMAFGADPGDGERNLSIAVGVGLVLAGALLFLLSISPGAAMILVTAALWAAAVEFFTTVRRVGYRPATLLGSVTVAGLALAVFWQGESAYPLVLALFTITGLLWYLAEADGERPTSGLAITALGVIWVGVLGSFAALILTLGEPATGILLGAIIGTVAYDVGAYAVGRLAGASQLAPDVSPNKTWEGLIGGMIAAIVVCTVLLGIVPGLSPWNDDGAIDALWLGITVAIAAPIGDLCQSLVKRDLGVKDMGTLLPGHGGVLDRFDALLFVLPSVYYLVRVVIF